LTPDPKARRLALGQALAPPRDRKRIICLDDEAMRS
jgi:hypothetical protein